MGLVALLIAVLMGWLSDRWTDLRFMIPIAAVLTALCFVTTNRPAFTEVEAQLSLSVESVSLNFILKLLYLSIAFSLGRVLSLLIKESDRRRPDFLDEATD